MDNQMVDIMSESKEKIVISKLTNNELATLRRLILGHGNLKGTAIRSGINHRTLERISLTGKGLEENINKIRDLLSAR